MGDSPRYPDIGAHGVVGNPRTAALVARDGTVDWWCPPEFHSPAVFAALLDRTDGGCFAVSPVEGTPVRQRYEPGTNVLRTVLDSPAGTVELVDFMPYFREDGEMVVRDEIHRRVRAVEGRPTVRVEFDPRFDFGRAGTTVETGDGRCRATGGDRTLTLVSDVPFGLETAERGRGAVGRRTLPEDATVWLTCRYEGPETGPLDGQEGGERSGDPETALARTRGYWRRWCGRCSYDGPWEDAVLRSALALKLLEHESTGAVVAAATTSLPETPGGTRNWDYRYTWIRDSTFSAWSFYRLGYHETSIDFLDLLEANLDPRRVPPVVDVHGDPVPDEETLDGFEGYRDSWPVRIGNDAAEQTQWGSYGAAIDGLYFSHRTLGGVGRERYESFVRPTVDHVAASWERPDAGIWEVRGGPRQFVTSKMWCWVVLDRGVRMARGLGYREDARRWEDVRDAIKSDVLEEGWSSEREAFTIAYGSDALDASTLLMPLVGFLPADHPKMRRTVEAVADELGEGPLLYRYRPEAVVSDPMDADEAAFTTCSFWLVVCLVELGQVEEARSLFEELLEYSNHLGLYAEEADPETGTQVGNFPQAYVHMGLINAATELNRALD